MNSDKNYSNDWKSNLNLYTTAERFKLTKSEVNNKLNILKEEQLIDNEAYENIKNEDTLLSIKRRTYQKCKKKIVIGIILIAVGLYIKENSGNEFLLTISGFILTISSFFGIISNRLTKSQVNYLNK